MTTAKNSVGEQCSISGLGDIQLGTALAGARKFGAAYNDGDPVTYRAEEMDGDGLRGFPVAWENGRGVYNAGADTITRGTVFESSNADAQVNFGSGLKRVFVALFVQDLGGTITAADITDSSATGRAVLKGDAGVGRGVLEVYSEQETLIKINAKFAEVFPMLIPLQAIQAKISCKVATIGNIDINAPLSAIAGIDLFDNERALVWQQIDELENGTYFLIDGYLSRYGRFYNDDLPTFSTLEIQQGAYTGRRFRVTSETATPGTAPMTWELVGRESLGLGSASLLDVAASGDATAGQVVKGDDSTLTNDRTASGLRTATTVVSVSAATAPSAGQTLVATSSTAATWQTPGGITAGDLAGGALPASLTTLATSGVASLAGLTLRSAANPAYSITYEDNSAYLLFRYAGDARVAFGLDGAFLNSSGRITWNSTANSFVSDRDVQIARNGVNRLGIGTLGVGNNGALELGAIRKKPYTVGTVPLSRAVGDVFEVVDALAPVVFSPVVAGGSVTTDVRWDGTNLIVKG